MANAAEITVGILNWQRPSNMQQVVMSVAGQNCKPAIWVWDNNPGGPKQGNWVDSVDVMVQSSRNLGCGAWAAMVALCTTEFIGKIDDDLAMLDNDVIGDCLSYLHDKNEDVLLGICGVALDPAKRYPDGKWHTNMPQANDMFVDIPKGRFLIARRSALMKAPFEALGHDGDVSWPGFLAGNRQQFHVIPAMLRGRFKNLPEGSEASCARPEHYGLRERLRRKWFKW